MELVPSFSPLFLHLFGKFIGKSADLFLPDDTFWSHVVTLGGLFVADMKKFSINDTSEFIVQTQDEAEDRTGLVFSPFLKFSPSLLKLLGSLSQLHLSMLPRASL